MFKHDQIGRTLTTIIERSTAFEMADRVFVIMNKKLGELKSLSTADLEGLPEPYLTSLARIRRTFSVECERWDVEGEISLAFDGVCLVWRWMYAFENEAGYDSVERGECDVLENTALQYFLLRDLS